MMFGWGKRKCAKFGWTKPPAAWRIEALFCGCSYIKCGFPSSSLNGVVKKNCVPRITSRNKVERDILKLLPTVFIQIIPSLMAQHGCCSTHHDHHNHDHE
jgi:hypothetical protein